MDTIEFGSHVYPRIDSLVGQVRHYTMTTERAVHFLALAVERIVLNGIPGALVECGVWRGGSVMAMALTLKAMSASREVWLYDTFNGMTPPGAEDGEVARLEYESRTEWCMAPLAEVARNVESTGYAPGNFRYVAGDICQRLPEVMPERAALLRLDSDWYASTLCELTHLYPRLSSGGCLIVDDYNCWPGSKRAVDEYFAEHGPVELASIDDVAVMAWKT